MALLACVVTLFATLLMIGRGVAEYAGDGEGAGELFRYFTINANLFTALAAAFNIPFAIEGMRKKRFTYPKWAALFHYSGTICTTLTMFFSVCMISWFDPHLAFGGNNLFLHLVCPVLVLVSFFMVESDNRYTFRDSVLCLIPYFIYCAVYVVQVVLVGEGKGGWSDIYHLMDIIPVYVTLPAMILLGFGIAAAVGLLSNKLNNARRKKLTALWRKDADPVEIRIEVFGLGRYTGKYGDKNNISLPLDIIGMLADRYNMKTDELIRAFVRGITDGLQEKEERKRQGRNNRRPGFFG